jgi:hypothetical protein
MKRFKLKENYETLEAGTIVYEFGGCTYGCCDDTETPCTIEPKILPFF